MKRIRNRKLTEHFSLYEAARTRQKKWIQFNREYVLTKIEKTLLTLNLLEHSRLAIKFPIFLSSLGRCIGLNKYIGGVNSSQHVECEAGDWTPLNKSNKHSVLHACDEVAKRFKKDNVMFGQLIFEERETSLGTKYWIHQSLGYPLRPLYKCRQVASITNGKFELAYQMTLKPWK